MKKRVRFFLCVFLFLVLGTSCCAQRHLKPLIEKAFAEESLPLSRSYLRTMLPSDFFPFVSIGRTVSGADFVPLPEITLPRPEAVFPVAFDYPLARKATPGFPAELKLLTKRYTEGVIFDLDGTLLDSLGAWEHSGSNYVRSLGIEPAEELDGILEKMSLLDGANLIKETYHLSAPPEEILAATLAPIKAHYYVDIEPKPKVPALLAFLHAQGIKMAVATASDAQLAKAALERLGLLHYFEFIITCDEVGVGKNSPLVYETARAQLGTPKNRTVVVEDALYALTTAHRAGFKTIGVAEKKSAANEAAMRRTADLFLTFY